MYLVAVDVERYDGLNEQVALVTGATRGIGEQIARGLVDRGATVYAGYRDRDDLSVEGCRGIELDVTVDETVRAAIAQIEGDESRLDILVNNAGIAGAKARLHENEVVDIDAVISVNLRGPMVLTRFALPLLLERSGSRVVNVSSGMGALREGMSGGYPAYRITKAGLNGLTVYLHGEYGEEGLIANAACPGWVRTDLGSPEAPKSTEEGADTPVWLATFAEGSPGGRFWRDRSPIDW